MMKNGFLIAAAVAGLAGVFLIAATGRRGNAPARPLDTARIEQLTGAKGALDPREGVFKVSVPRNDLQVFASGTHITPPMGLTSWAAFQRAGEGGATMAMVMGDLVLTEDQVSPVLDAALASGLEVTALHNHFADDRPRIMFMHIGGMGDEARLAEAVGRVFARIKETSAGRHAVAGAAIDPARSTLDPRRVVAVLGREGQLSGGVYKVTFGRTTRMHGQDVGSAMGVNTWAAFAGSDDRAVVDGDFAMTAPELQRVLRALRAARIDIVAIHQHMVGEQPPILFLHFWGVGRAEDLARGVRVALDVTQHG